MYNREEVSLLTGMVVPTLKITIPVFLFPLSYLPLRTQFSLRSCLGEEFVEQWEKEVSKLLVVLIPSDFSFNASIFDKNI